MGASSPDAQLIKDGRRETESCNGKLKARPSTWQREVLVCRTIALVGLSCAVLLRKDLDAIITGVWAQLRANRLFMHDSFEPLLSNASFYVYISVWMAVDHWVPWAWRYRIQDNTDMHRWYEGTRMRDQTLWYTLPLLALDWCFPRRRLPEEAPSAARMALEVAAAIAAYDALFFLWHVCAHKVPGLYRRFHAKHHGSAVQRACEAVQHTAVDGTMNVLCSVAALNLLRCHPLSRAAYNMVIIFLITELHCGYDLPFQLHNLAPLGLLGGPPRHDHHHRSGHVYYQKFGTYLDNLFGFVPPAGGPRARRGGGGGPGWWWQGWQRPRWLRRTPLAGRCGRAFGASVRY